MINEKSNQQKHLTNHNTITTTTSFSTNIAATTWRTWLVNVFKVIEAAE